MNESLQRTNQLHFEDNAKVRYTAYAILQPCRVDEFSCMWNPSIRQGGISSQSATAKCQPDGGLRQTQPCWKLPRAIVQETAQLTAAHWSWLEQVATTVSWLQSTSLGTETAWKTDHRLEVLRAQLVPEHYRKSS